jgi:hypothetical protein
MNTPELEEYEKKRERVRKWKAANKERIKEYNRSYYIHRKYKLSLILKYHTCPELEKS